MATVEFSAARIFAGTSANDGFNSEPILQTTYTLVYDADNRLVKVTWGSNSATFKYDGQGNRIKASITVGGTTTTTAYVGNYYELSGSTATKYYYAGAQMVAQRKGSAMYTLFSDHLGSVTATEDSAGHIIFQGYYPWGGIRTGTSNALPTDNTYTDQKTIESIGLMFYNARYYDSCIMRWLTPDTIIPNPYNPLDLDRYQYVHSNPINFNDPTGHEAGPCAFCNWWNQLYQNAMQAIGRSLVYQNNKADSLGDLMALAFFQEPSATITGQALDDIKGDKNMQAKQNLYADRIMADPRYGKEDFNSDFGTSPITFGEMGNNNMLEDSTYRETWTVRAANVSTFANVTKDGVINFNHTLSDTLDLVPDWDSGARTGVSGFFYNVVTTVAGGVWHGWLGARKMETSAQWTTQVSKSWREEKASWIK